MPALKEARTRSIKTVLKQQLAGDPEKFTVSRFERRENLHAIFRYPAMMVPSVQEDLIMILKGHYPNLKTLWDPFMGAGTALVSGLFNGFVCYGQDINPLAVLVAKVKTASYNLEDLKARTAKLGEQLATLTDVELHSLPNIEKWFMQDARQALSKIRQAIRIEPSIEIRRLFWVVLAETIRFCSNDRTTTFKLHALPKEKSIARRLDCIGMFIQKLEAAVEGIKVFQEKANEKGLIPIPSCEVVLGDTRSGVYPVDWPKQFDAVVTSPPYGDNVTTVTYGQYSYLQLQWIDLSDIDELVDDDCIRTTHEIDQRGLGGRKDPQLPRHEFGELAKKSKRFKELYLQIQIEYGNENRLSKFHNFYSDLYESCSHIVKRLSPHGIMLWTIGNRRIGKFEISNDIILKEFMRSLGVLEAHKVSREIRNKTIPFRNNAGKTMRQEQIIIFEHGKRKKRAL